MKATTYLEEFKTLEKLTLLFFLGISIFIKAYHLKFYEKFCFTGEGLSGSSCSGFFLDVVYTPLATADNELIIFFFFLLFLPLSIFHPWFKYIASWSIPLGIMFYISGGPGSSNIPTGGFTYSAFLELAVTGWVYLLIGFTLLAVGKQIVRQIKR